MEKAAGGRSKHSVATDSPEKMSEYQGKLYYPSDAKIECFGLILAIDNRDDETLAYLWDEKKVPYDERHFAYILDKMLLDQWDSGISILFRSSTAKSLFKSMSPMDKYNFLSTKIVDKVVEREYWEAKGKFKFKVKDVQVSTVIKELQEEPYRQFAVLQFPDLFVK